MTLERCASWQSETDLVCSAAYSEPLVTPIIIDAAAIGSKGCTGAGVLEIDLSQIAAAASRSSGNVACWAI